MIHSCRLSGLDLVFVALLYTVTLCYNYDYVNMQVRNGICNKCEDEAGMYEGLHLMWLQRCFVTYRLLMTMQTRVTHLLSLFNHSYRSQMLTHWISYLSTVLL
jgi:hypothetical protein